MDKHIHTADLQTILGPGKYKIYDDVISTPSPTSSSIVTQWITTYKPLLLIFALIVGVSSIVAFRSGGTESLLMQWMNYFMAGFFLVFSFFKFLDLKGFATSYAMYDVVAKRFPVYGFIYPFVELALGIAYLTAFNPAFTNWATLAIMGISSAGVIQSVVNKRKIKCACLGSVFNLPMSTVTIIEDVSMAGMAATMLFLYGH